MKLSGTIVTFKEIADRLGVTRERVSQIIKKTDIPTENPCSRCGSSTTLVRASDAKKLTSTKAAK